MDTNNILPLTSFLLPIDGSEPCLRAVNFAGCLASRLGERLKKITLLHVFGDGYLSEHMANIDFRVDHILKSDQFKILRQQYIESTVKPMLDGAEEVIRTTCPYVDVEQMAIEGRPAEQIAKISQEGGYSTIIIARRGLGKYVELILGSVTSYLLHLPIHPTIYVAGNLIMEGGSCLLPNILVPVDGSPSAFAAVVEAAVIAKTHGESLKKIVLLTVMDISRYVEQVETGINPEEEAEKILHEAKELLLENGVQERYIETLAVHGKPVDSIMEEAKKQETTLIMMGRKGRYAMKEVLMGSVSNEVLHRCTDPTVAIVCK